MGDLSDKKQQIPGYKLLTRLGTGGQANVYKAVQISMNRHVAVKVIMPESGVPDTELGRFMREARVLARLRHENIVQAIDYGEEEGIRYLVMEFIEGESVLDLVEREASGLETRHIDTRRQGAPVGISTIPFNRIASHRARTRDQSAYTATQHVEHLQS